MKNAGKNQKGPPERKIASRLKNLTLTQPLIINNTEILSLTHSHHHHNCRQIPNMVWICHGGNLPLGHLI